MCGLNAGYKGHGNDADVSAAAAAFAAART